MTTTTVTPVQKALTDKNQLDPMLRVAAWVFLASAALWGLLFFRWITFGTFDWTPFELENQLATLPTGLAYPIYGLLLFIDLIIGGLILRKFSIGRSLGLGRGVLLIIIASVYWAVGDDFFGAIFFAGISGLMLLLLTKQSEWSLNYPAAFWLIVFFVLPNVIVLIISLSERGPRGTIVYPDLTSIQGIAALFDDYGRFFSRIGGEYIYLRIFWRSFNLALGNTIICLIFGYPFAYWIARQAERWRNILIFLVMIPFWTNFLVRTYAWMLLLRDSGLINNFWTITLHEQAVALSANNAFFARIASISEQPLPLLFNQGAVFMGLFYGFFPFIVLPIYSNLEKMDWSLLEAASDLGANNFQSTIRVLLPLSMPGIVAAAIIVFVPSLGAYVTPALMGGGKVALLGNLLQQQFMTSRDWPFGSAIGFLMMAIMLLAIMIYFRVGGRENE